MQLETSRSVSIMTIIITHDDRNSDRFERKCTEKSEQQVKTVRLAKQS